MTVVATRPVGAGERLHGLIAELFPITRSIAGPGFRATLDRLEDVCGPLERHTFRTGERVHDWAIPEEWELRSAWIRDPSGRVVVDAAASNLHVVSHSVPVRARMTLDELQAHLHSLPDQPDAIPYRTSYYEPAWGFCLTERVRAALEDGEYEVCIDATLGPGVVELGEVVVEGREPGEILLSTYCCHPSMANNELSGPVVTAELARRLREGPAPRLTHRLIWVPETIGAIAYLSRFGERLREHLVAGYVITCIGHGEGMTFKRSRRGDTLADRAAEHVLAHRPGRTGIVDFYPASSDERQFCSPGYDLPVGSLMRRVHGSWPEYHTSLDDLELVTPAALADSLRACEDVLAVHDANETFAATVVHGEPQLGRRGLYPTAGGAWPTADRVNDLEDMMFLLNFCDGSADLLTAAERSGRPVAALHAVADRLAAHGLLDRV